MKVSPKLKKFSVRFLIGAVFVFAFVMVEIMLNETWYNPAVIVPLFGWVWNGHFAAQTILGELDDGGTYPLIPISTLNNSQWFKARAAVTGVVTDEVHAWDGDWHLNVRDKQGNVLVAEISPELPVPLPPLRTPIRLWGVTRYDLGHRWWEIHPVIGWEADQARTDRILK